MKKNLDAALRAHTNLNTFAAIVAMLEGGTVYSTGINGSQDKTASRIIRLCHQEQQRQLRKLDAATAKIGGQA